MKNGGIAPLQNLVGGVVKVFTTLVMTSTFFIFSRKKFFNSFEYIIFANEGFEYKKLKTIILMNDDQPKQSELVKDSKEIELEQTFESLQNAVDMGLIEASKTLFDLALQTMRKKNADYSGSDKDMKSFETSATVANIPMSKGILVRLMDKMTRIGNLIEKGSLTGEVGESIFDTIQDAINYSAILYYGIVIEQRDQALKNLKRYKENQELKSKVQG
jgi:hypothetical protein